MDKTIAHIPTRNSRSISHLHCKGSIGFPKLPKQEITSLLPSSETIVSSYLFHGTPDILIEDDAVLMMLMQETEEEG